MSFANLIPQGTPDLFVLVRVLFAVICMHTLPFMNLLFFSSFLGLFPLLAVKTHHENRV